MMERLLKKTCQGSCNSQDNGSIEMFAFYFKDSIVNVCTSNRASISSGDAVKECHLVVLSSLFSKVDQEIVKVIQERMRACYQREGSSYVQNCAKEIEQFEETSKNFQLRCK